jgi:hypothetical protein
MFQLIIDDVYVGYIEYYDLYRYGDPVIDEYGSRVFFKINRETKTIKFSDDVTDSLFTTEEAIEIFNTVLNLKDVLEIDNYRVTGESQFNIEFEDYFIN